MKRDDGDEKLEEWKKERLLEKSMSPSVSGVSTVETHKEYDWLDRKDEKE